MHPPLVEHQHQVCSEYIQALEDCHKSGLMARYTGKCNDAKNELNACLRRERKAKAITNNQSAKEKRQKIKDRWAEVDSSSTQT